MTACSDPAAPQSGTCDPGAAEAQVRKKAATRGSLRYISNNELGAAKKDSTAKKTLGFEDHRGRANKVRHPLVKFFGL